jgi:hypothetical protein
MMRHVLVMAALALVGCGRRDAEESRAQERPQAALATRDTGFKLAAGDIRIVSADSAVELALIGSRIMMRLSDKTVAEIKRKTDTTNVSGSGFAASIEKMVKSGVASALNQQVEYPLSEVRDARYEDGEIKLEMNGKGPRLFEQTRVNKTPVMKSFRPEDAQAFVAAVQARKKNQYQ